ncbi:MAG: tripartite tricarboxylate transporter substrate binding protein [Candidatus Rokubacteria bacterium]|nr:tripartite tricarboxylate transporter substrate binding protein [Candidatus Rokubacteria bacterium]
MRGKRLRVVSAVLVALVLAVGLLALGADRPAQAAWQPSKPVEFIIMAGQGGGADVYARFISGLIEKHKLAPVPFVPLNKAGGAGAVAMEHVRGKSGDPHTIMITLSSFVMTPIIQKLPFSYKDFTPISLVALDNFFLWVQKDSPWKSVKEFVAAAQKESLTVAGTGSKQEDELIFTFFEQKADLKPFKYVPFKGGGTVAANLVGGQVKATVNNPSEGLPHYPGKLRPLATFATERHKGQFADLPTMKELGYDISYQMMRGIFGPPKMPVEAREYYAGLMKKVFDLEDFQAFLDKNVLDARYLAGDEFGRWVGGYNDVHVQVIQKAGWSK